MADDLMAVISAPEEAGLKALYSTSTYLPSESALCLNHNGESFWLLRDDLFGLFQLERMGNSGQLNSVLDTVTKATGKTHLTARISILKIAISRSNPTGV